MIPSAWEAVHRPEDGELVGYLAPHDDGLVVPTTLTGTPAGAPDEPEAAAGLLVASGLARLARRWWCRLPDTLPPGLLDAGGPTAHWDWRPVVLVEVSPAGCRVRPEAPTPEEGGAQASLPVPVGTLLREQPPG
ncbi:hypothetical protein [Modestobacter italicus]|uniref:hypothetical protein n=1 Tax=Modestobacter italicus (strain DSM 44449 / CECT 9708 / BC 501) TaxID=2732864 RepID=UPI001C96495E|nr:hypothetical protein [Modestobacter italicus]